MRQESFPGSAPTAVRLEALAVGGRRQGVNGRWRVWRRAVRFRLLGLGLLLLAGFAGMAVFAPLLSPHDPLRQDIARRLLPPLWVGEGSSAHLLGTDQLGRDVLSRLIHGARVSLVVAFGASLLGATMGLTVGVLAGHVGGWVDVAAMRLADAQIAFPFLVIAIAATALMGASLFNLVLVLAIWGWAQFAKIARAEVRAIEALEYIPAVRALGAGGSRLIGWHVLPNLMPVALVVWMFSLALMLFAESSLSFLGFGVQPPSPSWGGMLEDGRAHIATAWWLETFPGLAIMMCVLAVNLVGEGLRQALDPRALW